MEARPIAIVYVDDVINQHISRYLDNYCFDCSDYNLIYEEVTFSSGDTYESLLQEVKIRTANILLIDSKLFEEATVRAAGMFSGEEFGIILNKLFPYIEVVIISQNALNIKYNVVEKCKGETDYTQAKEYYDEKLMPVLEDKISAIVDTREIIERLRENNTIDRVIIEKIYDTANGGGQYDELKASDIDKLVNMLNQIMED